MQYESVYEAAKVAAEQIQDKAVLSKSFAYAITQGLTAAAFVNKMNLYLDPKERTKGQTYSRLQLIGSPSIAELNTPGGFFYDYTTNLQRFVYGEGTQTIEEIELKYETENRIEG